MLQNTRHLFLTANPKKRRIRKILTLTNIRHAHANGTIRWNLASFTRLTKRTHTATTILISFISIFHIISTSSGYNRNRKLNFISQARDITLTDVSSAYSASTIPCCNACLIIWASWTYSPTTIFVSFISIFDIINATSSYNRNRKLNKYNARRSHSLDSGLNAFLLYSIPYCWILSLNCHRTNARLQTPSKIAIDDQFSERNRFSIFCRHLLKEIIRNN